MIILVSILASVAALLGGVITLKMRDKLHLVLGFSAGAVIGAALLDLIPEAIELGEPFYEAGVLTAITAAGFLIYLIVDRLFPFHGHEHENEGDCGCREKIAHSIQGQNEQSQSSNIATSNAINRGSLGAASFCLHSLIDGIAIGLAFQASAALGAIVAVAVVAHRFSDGINTVGVILKNRGEMRHAVGWLSAVAIAPIVGTLSTFAFSVPDNVLAIILATFAGFFLYIGASDLIPEGHHSHSRFYTTAMTLLGAVVLYVIIMIAE